MTAAAAQASSMITLIRKLKITVKMPMKNKSRENIVLFRDSFLIFYDPKN